MGVDAMVLATGFDSLAAAFAVAEQARAHTMGPTERTPLGAHRRVSFDPTALVRAVEAYCDPAGTPIVAVATGLRWKPDPREHTGLASFLDVCSTELPGLTLHYTTDDVAFELRFGDRTFAHAAGTGELLSIT